MLRQRMTADLPSRRVSERVEPWMTPVAPINWTQVSMVDTVPSHSPHLPAQGLLGPLEIDIKCLVN